MTTRYAPLRVVVLAHDDINLLDFTGPVQTLFTASRRHSKAGQALYEVIVASESGGLVTTSSGVQVMTVGLSALEGLAIDTLIAPGGCKGEERRACRTPTHRSVSIPTGYSFVMAPSGRRPVSQRAST